MSAAIHHTRYVIDEIRGQKLNRGDCVLTLLAFPVHVGLASLAPPYLIFDDVRNGENLGSIIRTAYCLGVTSIIVCLPWGR